ncbi:glycosyltransferase family 87 protein [Variovorax dokdonensis]|uniref:Glycosyltransferase family 87 protein n=1 Tax=Variovorax dokdonensis TaxID=344883 RepID=A0ABT7NDA3_9BURK|nr:glycosyltransferase family 87 protein [Variovorax dokdonensis]MDM0045927.1 glycosyltransferase family 87 protein [Variovorax dokdonensis]
MSAHPMNTPPSFAARRQQFRCWRFWLLLVVGATALNDVVLRLAGLGADSTIRTAQLLLTNQSYLDSWAPMLKASDFLIAHPDTSTFYQTIFFEQRVKFQYPLTSLLIIDIPRRLLGVDAAVIIKLLLYLSRLAVPAIGLAFAALMKNALAETRSGDARTGLLNAWIAVGVGVLSAALFYPIARSEVLGQIQTLMTLLAALALLAWQRGARFTSGLLLGLCCVVKPHWAVLLAWAVLRRQWQFASAAAAVMCGSLLVAWAFYGAGNVLGYVSVVEFIGRHGESFFANQSVNGLVNRMLFNGNNTEWDAHAFAPFHPVVYAATVSSTVILLLFALLWRRRDEPTALHLCVALLALTMASPIAWEHHYGVLFPMYALALPAMLDRRPLGSATLPILALTYLLTSQSFSPLTNLLAQTRWNVLQSYQLFGAALMLWLVARLARDSARHGAATP